MSMSRKVTKGIVVDDDATVEASAPFLFLLSSPLLGVKTAFAKEGRLIFTTLGGDILLVMFRGVTLGINFTRRLEDGVPGLSLYSRVVGVGVGVGVSVGV